MVRLNEGLDRSAARKASYQEPDDELGPEVSETPVQQHRRSKRKAAAEAEDDQPPRQRLQSRANTSRDDNNSSEQKEFPPALTAPDRVRIDQVIADLVKAGKDTLIFCDTTPLKSEPEVHPPALDLTLLKLTATELSFFEDSALYGYLTSNNFLPCISQWKK